MNNIIKITSIIIPFVFFPPSSRASPDGFLENQPTQLTIAQAADTTKQKPISNLGHHDLHSTTVEVAHNDMPYPRKTPNHSDKISWQCATNEPPQT